MKIRILKFLRKKVSIAALIIFCALVSFVSFKFSKSINTHLVTHSDQVINNCPDHPEKIRLNSFNLIKPLLLEDVSSESETYRPLKTKIENYIDVVKSKHQAEDISIYFRRLNDGSWFSVNPNQTYYPAGMKRIVYLITYLKESETNPEILSKKLFLRKHFIPENPSDNIKYTLKLDVNYTVRELLSAMIKNSDYDARTLLVDNMNMKIYNQLFSNLKIPAPSSSEEYAITISDFSKVYRILFNATYIKPEFSEYALELLTKNSFDDGLRQGVDSTIEIAHKMGERLVKNKQQLNEFGIVYIKNNPYLLGVMANGTSKTDLSEIIKEISRITFSEFQSNI